MITPCLCVSENPAATVRCSRGPEPGSELGRGQGQGRGQGRSVGTGNPDLRQASLAFLSFVVACSFPFVAMSEA